MDQLSLCTTTIEPVVHSLKATTTEPMCCNYWSPHTLEPVLHNRRSQEACAPQLENSLHSLPLEKAHTQQGRPSTAENNSVVFNILTRLNNYYFRKFTSAPKAHTHFVVLVQLLSHVLLFVTPWAVAYTRPLCPLLSPRVCADACPLSWWCYLTIPTSSY